jgi:tripartite-type tricarboxylate transporter receptor subunit TctC
MRVFLLSVLFLLTGNVYAWEPTKPIDTVIGWSPGSGNDVSFRIVSAQVEKMTGAKFVIRYRPGAGGAIANSEVVKSHPDGYTLVVASSSSLTATDKILVPNKTWDIESFTNVIGYAGAPVAVFASSDDPVNSIKDLAKVLKTEKLAFGNPGGASRIAYEMLKYHMGFTESKDGVVQITYKGNPETITAVMSKEIRFGTSPIAVVMEHVKAGKIKIIGITSQKPIPSLPNIPVFTSVYPDLHYNLIWGITMPKDVPEDIFRWYETAFNLALNTDIVKAQLQTNTMFIDTRTLSSKGYTEYLIKQRKTLEPLVDIIIESQKNNN